MKSKTLRKIKGEVHSGQTLRVRGQKLKARIWNNTRSCLLDPDTNEINPWYFLFGEVCNGVMYNPTIKENCTDEA